MATISEARVATTHGSNYLRQLCRHWAHKFPVTFDDQQGTITLPTAVCKLEAVSDLLIVHLEVMQAGDEARMQQVVAEHLQRFGFREQLAFDWKPAQAVIS